MTPKRVRTLTLLALTAAPLIAVAACRPPAPEPPQRAENPRLGIAVAAVPEPFRVVSVDGDTIELVAPGSGGDGRAVIAAGPLETTGINLVEAVKQKKAWYEATPGATYFGNRELGTPIGPAFTARGSYPVDGTVVEETQVYAVHPLANRLLTLTFTYPTGESQERVQQLIALLGEIEGLASVSPGDPG